MPIRARVSCVNKREHSNPHERILNIGGVNPNGSQWKLSQPEAIRGIQEGMYSFYVTVGGAATEVVVAYHNGNPYLKTVQDTTDLDNLLDLPDCSK